MAKGKTEKERKLTPAEEKRLAKFEAAATELAARGYRRTDLTVGIVGANVFSIVLAVPVFVLGVWLFFKRNGLGPIMAYGMWGGNLGRTLLLLGGIAAFTVIHELVHGLAWSFFAPDRFKSIEFGFIAQYLTPYCACTAPLKKGQYIVGALAPLVLVGVLPAALGILWGSFFLLITGLVMTVGAAGDILVVKNILAHKTAAKDILYMDHPTQAGGVIFER